MGHRYLIEKAATENDEVVVFVVEEDKSIFPTDVRFELVKKGCEDLKNVIVLKGEGILYPPIHSQHIF